jgi:hypothetical protein
LSGRQYTCGVGSTKAKQYRWKGVLGRQYKLAMLDRQYKGKHIIVVRQAVHLWGRHYKSEAVQMEDKNIIGRQYTWEICSTTVERGAW